MDEIFGGFTVVHALEFPVGAVIMLDNSENTLYVKNYQRVTNEYGEAYDYDEIESYEIGDTNDYFYDEKGKLREPKEITDMLVHEIIYKIGFYPEEDDFLIDGSIPYYYDRALNG